MLQFISRCRKDGEQIYTKNANDDDSNHVETFCVRTNSAVDEIQRVEMMHSGMTLGSSIEEAASVLIRNISDI